MVYIIAAIDKDLGLGAANQLLFWIPADLKHFKQLTTGHTILMGRKTFESLPNGALPNRRNIVISRSQDFVAPGAEVYHSIEEALAHCSDEDVYIIGGASIYQQSIQWADVMILTEIEEKAPKVDAYFPKWEPSEWTEVSRESHPENVPPYSFVTYQHNLSTQND